MTDTKEITSYKEELVELRKQLSEMLPKEALSTFDNDAEQLQKTHQNILKLQKGDTTPNFTLPNALGKMISLEEMLQKSRIVLVFYRGTWCPYCNLQLNQYQRNTEKLRALNTSLIAISPQTPNESLNIKEKNELKFEVLSDKGNAVARHFTTVFRNGDAPVDTMTNLGFDFDAFYGDDSREIPVPAVFIIEQDGTITFAKTEGGDYRNRVEIQEILKVLEG